MDEVVVRHFLRSAPVFVSISCFLRKPAISTHRTIDIYMVRLPKRTWASCGDDTKSFGASPFDTHYPMVITCHFTDGSEDLFDHISYKSYE